LFREKIRRKNWKTFSASRKIDAAGFHLVEDSWGRETESRPYCQCSADRAAWPTAAA
jgi:hypothetical protein